LAALLHSLQAVRTATSAQTVETILRRLKLSNDEIQRIMWLVDHQDDLADAPALPLCRLKRTLSHEFRDDLIRLLRVKLLATGADPQPVLFCDEYLARTPADVINPPPLITGDVLKSLGLVPGPAFRTVLESVRDAQLNDEIATAEEAIARARRLVAPSG
jgi:poly(A) polymerase